MTDTHAAAQEQPICQICHAELEWRTCFECGGNGGRKYVCPTCKNKGGWWQCPQHHYHDGTDDAAQACPEPPPRSARAGQAMGGENPPLWDGNRIYKEMTVFSANYKNDWVAAVELAVTIVAEYEAVLLFDRRQLAAKDAEIRQLQSELMTLTRQRDNLLERAERAEQAKGQRDERAASRASVDG